MRRVDPKNGGGCVWPRTPSAPIETLTGQGISQFRLFRPVGSAGLKTEDRRILAWYITRNERRERRPPMLVVTARLTTKKKGGAGVSTQRRVERLTGSPDTACNRFLSLQVTPNPTSERRLANLVLGSLRSLPGKSTRCGGQISRKGVERAQRRFPTGLSRRLDATPRWD